jgi:hypothetical protein
MIDNDVVTCVRCGQHRDADTSPTKALAWVSEREAGVTRWLCPQCARMHVRDIEGKLPHEYW